MEQSKIIYLRAIPADLSNKLKAAAALEGTSLQQYLVRLLQAHIADLERRGVLPKPKGK